MTRGNMFTQCPTCDSTFRVSAENLRGAMGMVRCTQCQVVFNALATLRDVAEVDTGSVTDVGVQLPFERYGDETLIDQSAVRALFDQLREATTPRALPAAELARSDRGAAAVATPPAPEPPPAQIRGFVPGQAIEGESGQTPLLWRLLPAGLLLALRNLTRQRKRTGLALAGIGFGAIALMLAGGFMEWVFWAMRESAIQGRLGHIQVTRPGFLEAGVARPFDYVLPDHAPEFDAISKAPHVALVAPRLTFTGLASRGEISVPFLADGVDPVKEARLSVDFRIARGEGLSEADGTGIIVGMGLADLIGVKPGDTLTLLATTADGGLNGVETHVRGVFYTSNKVWNDGALRVPIALARDLLRVQGAHTWVVLLDDTRNTAPALDGLRALLAARGAQLELTPWTALADFYNKTVGLFTRQMNVVRLIIGLIIVLSISNVLVMGVLQRTSEIGTLMAVGLRRRRILALFLSEGALLGLLGGGFGVAAGWALAELISYIGIPMPPAPGMDKGFTAEIRVTWPLALGTFALAALTTLAAGIYPAWKASRLGIVDALRHSK